MYEKKKVIIILVLLNILFIGKKVAYSFYHSSIDATLADLTFAKFIFNNEESTDTSISLEGIKPGDSIEHRFKVSNTKNGINSDVNILYRITLETYQLLPVKIELYQITDTKNLVLTLDDEKCGRNSENKLVCSTNDFLLSHGVSDIDDFLIKISFDLKNDKNQTWSYEYADLVDFIDIKINSWQAT